MNGGQVGYNGNVPTSWQTLTITQNFVQNTNTIKISVYDGASAGGVGYIAVNSIKVEGRPH